ncbi:beta-ketoacyl-ACP synthase II [Gimibacter soli]|uniref:3-oxoacyl-[acyl-carrier-protein] synthase 2 n=1 Tax=Gimibacter soli TaxID=3024400 RepID=A0AAE9XPP3_9PROT|nr:beta-ketoacyl-ACP synthase II [Gimibacter soli]WCL52791.1 beta-ketoacyl-ACP synthase II [Gimibacter soli]
MRRVVVTGMGMVSPLATGVEKTWDSLVAGKSAATRITKFEVTDLPCQIGCEVVHGDGSGRTFNPDDWMAPKDQRRVDPFILYGMAAATQAVEDAGWADVSEEEKIRTGVMIGAGIGGLQWIAETSLVLNERGHRKVSPHFIAGSIINLVSGNLSIKYGFKGPNHSVVTACATGTHAIGDAARLIALDDADVMIAGGAEASVCAIAYAGFSQARALATAFNDTPEKASRPWDQDRDGFVMGEGAGVVVLEELEHAKKRGAKIYGEVIGYGMSGDGYHVTAPAPDGSGGYRAMEAAIKRAGIAAGDIDYINAHGTSTPLGDEIEFGAVKRLLGDAAGKVAMSSTKSAIGHLLGAAGAVEAIFSLQAINKGVVPPTLNLDNPAESCTGINLVPHTAQEKKVKIALSNSFGFGGTNASIIVRAYEGD